MDAFQFVASLVSSLAWPAIVLAVVLVLRTPIAELLGRLVKFKGAGFEGEFDPEKAEPIVQAARAEAAASAPAAVGARAGMASGTGAAHDATVIVRESLASSMADAAEAYPAAAVLSAYAEVENALRDRMARAEVAGADELSGDELVEKALRKRMVSPQTAVAIRGVGVLRNLAAHGGDVDAAKAREYLALADAVIYAINTWLPMIRVAD